MYGRERSRATYEISTEILSAAPPARLTVRVGPATRIGGRVFLRSPGAAGYRVATYRMTSGDGRRLRREFISDDSYQTANRIVMLMQAQAP